MLLALGVDLAVKRNMQPDQLKGHPEAPCSTRKAVLPNKCMHYLICSVYALFVKFNMRNARQSHYPLKRLYT